LTEPQNIFWGYTFKAFQHGMPVIRAGGILALLTLIVMVWPVILSQLDVEYSVYVSAGGESLQQDASIEILGAWDKTNLQVYFAPSGEINLDDAARDGVEIWYAAIREFTARYGFTYLASLSYSTVGSSSDADVTVRYVSSLEEGACGVARYGFRFITGALSYVRVEISRQCVGSSSDLAFKVVAHEYGHALGLGHSTYSRDLMYSYVNSADKPSTLNLYGLAVAYQWLSSGTFRDPPDSNVRLPGNISYEYIAGVAQRHLVRILMDTGVGGMLVLAEEVMEHGAQLTYAVDDLLSYENGTEFRFAGWFKDDRFISPRTDLTISINSDTVLVAKYDPYYRVVINLGYGELIERWVKRGMLLTFSAQQTVMAGSGERRVFNGWSDGVNDSTRVVEISGPLELEALWKTQYYLEVESDYAVIGGGGWYDAGTWATLTVGTSFVNLGEGVRMHLSDLAADPGIIIEKIADDIYRVYVDSPSILRAVWIREFYVDVVATHGPAVIYRGWVAENTSIQLHARELLTWNNGTRAVFSAWDGIGKASNPLHITVDKPLHLKAMYKPFYIVRIVSELPLKSVSSWVERGSAYVLDAGDVIRPGLDGGRYRFLGWDGDVNIESSIATIPAIEGPLTVRAIWAHEYPVTISDPERSFEEWVMDGGWLTYNAQPIIQQLSNRRLVFDSWSGDLTSVDGLEARVYVDGPKRLQANYIPEVLVVLRFKPLTGVGDVEALAQISVGGSSQRLMAGGEYWLPVGRHSIVGVFFRNVDVAAMDTLDVQDPGEYDIPVRIFNVKLKITDLLGLPFADAGLTVDGGAGVEAVTSLDKDGESPNMQLTWAAERAIVESWPLRYEVPLRPESGEIWATMPLSPTGLYLVLTLSTVATVSFTVLLRRIRR
jgi:hypothetical protein